MYEAMVQLPIDRGAIRDERIGQLGWLAGLADWAVHRN